MNSLNRVKMNVTGAPGLGPVSLNTALPKFQSFDDAGAVNLNVYTYLIEDGLDWEIGPGLYTTAGALLARANPASPLFMSSTGGLLNLTAAAIVGCVESAQNFNDIVTKSITIDGAGIGNFLGGFTALSVFSSNDGSVFGAFYENKVAGPGYGYFYYVGDDGVVGTGAADGSGNYSSGIDYFPDGNMQANGIMNFTSVTKGIDPVSPEDLTTKAYVDAQLAGGSISIRGHNSPGTSSDAYSADYAAGLCVVLEAGGTISKVGFFAAADSALTQWEVALYSDASGVMVNKLAETTAPITGVVYGANSAELDTPYTNTTGSDILVWLTILPSVAGISIRKNSNDFIRYWNNGGLGFPAVASAQTQISSGWDMYGIS